MLALRRVVGDCGVIGLLGEGSAMWQQHTPPLVRAIARDERRCLCFASAVTTTVGFVGVALTDPPGQWPVLALCLSGKVELGIRVLARAVRWRRACLPGESLIGFLARAALHVFVGAPFIATKGMWMCHTRLSRAPV